MTTPDPASYYESGKFASWDIIEAFQLSHYEACILKYLLRWRRKHDDPEQQQRDLDKLIAYAERLKRQHFGGHGRTKDGGYYHVNPTAPVSPLQPGIP